MRNRPWYAVKSGSFYSPYSPFVKGTVVRLITLDPQWKYLESDLKEGIVHQVWVFKHPSKWLVQGFTPVRHPEQWVEMLALEIEDTEDIEEGS